MERNSRRIDKLKHAIGSVSASLQDFQHNVIESLLSMATAIEITQQNVSTVHTAFTAFRADYKFNRRVKAACGIVSGFLYALQDVLDLAYYPVFERVVDFGNLKEFQQVIQEENFNGRVGVMVGEVVQEMTIKEAFGYGLEKAQDFATGKLYQTAKNCSQVVLLAATLQILLYLVC
jgi:hypothetical protein